MIFISINEFENVNISFATITVLAFYFNNLLVKMDNDDVIKFFWLKMALYT